MTSVTDYLVKLGFKQYEASIFAALSSLGFSGVADIHRVTNIPRNKVYETLEEFARRGIVEVRPGRPRIFKLIRPRSVIEQLTQDYSRTAKEALQLLEEETTHAKPAEERDYVWIIRGERALKQRFAELISDAKKDILVVEPFPPTYLSSYRSILTAAKRRGVKVRAISLASSPITTRPPKERLVEYRTVKNKTDALAGVAEYDRMLLPYLRETLRVVALHVLVDRERAFIMTKGFGDKKDLTGAFLRIPGVTSIMGATWERMLALFTRQI